MHDPNSTMQRSVLDQITLNHVQFITEDILQQLETEGNIST